MKQYLLDTSVIIDFLREKPKAIQLIESLPGDIVSSTICLAELYEGVYRSHNTKKQEQLIDILRQNLSALFPIDEAIARTFGELRAELKKRGALLEDFDLLIAATCITYELTLVTYNDKHFSRIPTLEIYPIKK